MKNYPLLLLCIFLTPLFLHAQEDDMEVSEYSNAKVEVTPLPVFSKDPLDVGKKCFPVFDVLIDDDGIPLFADTLYAPDKSFKNSYLKALSKTTYTPAKMHGEPVPSLRRHAVYSYFYLYDSEEKITTLPESLWGFSPNAFMMGMSYEDYTFQLEIDENGVLTKGTSINTEGSAIGQKFIKNKIGQKLFSPAYAGEKPVPCTLRLYFGDDCRVPKVVTHTIGKSLGIAFDKCYSKKDVSDFQMKMDTMLRPISTTKKKYLKLKIQYGWSRTIRSVLPMEKGAITAEELWTLSQGMRLWIDCYERDENRRYDLANEDVSILISPDQTIEVIEKDFFLILYPNIKHISLPRAYRLERGSRALIEFSIDEEGFCSDFNVIRTTSNTIADVCIKALERFRFEPTLYKGKPVKVTVQFPFDDRMIITVL